MLKRQNTRRCSQRQVSLFQDNKEAGSDIMTNYVISQILGIIVTVLCLIGPHFKKKWQMCANTVLANFLSALGMLFVGQLSATGCCAVAIIQSLLRIWHLHKDTKPSKIEIGIFAIAYVAGGLLPYVVSGTLSEFGWLDVMPIVGALVLMISIVQRKEQPSRAIGLVNAIIYFIYDLIIMNTQIFAQLAGIVSTSIALFRNRKKKATKEALS